MKHDEFCVENDEFTSAELEKMSASLGGKLMSLKVDDNKLTSLPLQWESLKLIRHLSASSNGITELADEIGLLKQMEFLNMEDNKVDEFLSLKMMDFALK